VLEKQDKSLDEYHDTHEQENLSPTILYVMNQFRRFIGYHLALSSHNLNYPPFILDVGCGISKKIPLYFREISTHEKAIYIGLDPIPINKDRNYLFINGKFENLHNYLYTFRFFDCLIFSTSLDHFPDLEAVKSEIYHVLKKNGLAFFWVGLHDPNIVGELYMHESWRDFNFLSISGILCRVSSFPISIIKIYRSLKRRKLLLDRGNPLDELHFHYFTSNKLLNYRNRSGTSLIIVL